MKRHFAILITDGLTARRFEFKSEYWDAVSLFRLVAKKVAWACGARGIEVPVEGEGAWLFAPEHMVPELPGRLGEGKALKMAVLEGVLVWLLDAESFSGRAMGCDYWVAPIDVPLSAVKRVKRLMEEHDISDLFDITVEEEKAVISMHTTSMGYSTVDLVENFLAGLARVLKGTPFDGQVLSYDFDLGEQVGVHVLVAGKMFTIPFDREVYIKAKVIGLPGGRAIVEKVLSE